MDAHKGNLLHLLQYHSLFPSLFLDFLFDKGYVKLHQAKELPIKINLINAGSHCFNIIVTILENL